MLTYLIIVKIIKIIINNVCFVKKNVSPVFSAEVDLGEYVLEVITFSIGLVVRIT